MKRIAIISAVIIGRVRNVVMGPDGLVYVAIENPGKIVRLIPME